MAVILFTEDILEAFERWRFRDNLPADGHKKNEKERSKMERR
ncbi:unnamed protein product [Rhodiola kirilowii]